MGKDFKDDADFEALSTSLIQNLCEAAGVAIALKKRATDVAPLTITLRRTADVDEPALDALREHLPAEVEILWE